MQYIQYIEESQTYVVPKTGKYKVICVGGGGTGILYTTSTEVANQYIYQNGNPTSFGSYLTANGSQINNPKTTLYTDSTTVSDSINLSSYTHIGGYGGYDGNNYGGNPESIFCNARYRYFSSGNIGNSDGGTVEYCPPEGNGGSLSDASMSGNYGSGGFSKILVNKASKLSTLKFTYKAYYDGFTYTYTKNVHGPNGSSTSSTNTATNTASVPGGYIEGSYYGSGDFITSEELQPSSILPLDKTVAVQVISFSSAGYTSPNDESYYYTTKDIPITKYVFDAEPVVSSTSVVVPLYPIKVRNNGCMKVDIIELNEGDEIPCTIGLGGRAQDAGVGAVSDESYMNSGISSESTIDFSGNIGDGSNGVIIIQFLGE